MNYFCPVFDTRPLVWLRKKDLESRYKMPVYTRWRDVPEYLVTRSSFEESGLDPKNRIPVAIKSSFGTKSAYWLYDMRLAPVLKLSLSEVYFTFANNFDDEYRPIRIKIRSNSSGTWKLKRIIQCSKCPWKVGTNPEEIPNGYCEEKHRSLANTIADPKNPLSDFFNTEFRIMACHHSDPENGEHCVGWVFNQMGVGNNIRLRLRMMNCENYADLQVIGEQHKRFEDTLPKL